MIKVSDTYFDITRDKQFPFFCQGCLVGKPKNKLSFDPRYCGDCYDFLLAEAEMLSPGSRPRWIPKPQKLLEKLYPMAQPINKQNTKMSILNSISPTVDNFRPRGRPKTYNKRSLPNDKIKQLHKDGMGARAIASKLKKEQGINVSYKTIQRVLSGERG